MADNGKIKVTLGEGVEVELDKDTPNLKEFVKSITAPNVKQFFPRVVSTFTFTSVR